MLRVSPKSSHLKENFFSPFFPLFLLYVYRMMNVSWTYCGSHFTIYVNQTIMLCTLNVYSDVCQLFLSKTGKKETMVFIG